LHIILGVLGSTIFDEKKLPKFNGFQEAYFGALVAYEDVI